jgi:hypothetical protein
MPNYCLVENGVVTQAVGTLPKSWKNVSGLDKMSDAKLKLLGWLPTEDVHLAYDNTTHYRISPTIDIQTDKVVYTDVVVAFTAEELTQNAKNNARSEIARLVELQTDRLIREVHLGYGANPNPGPISGKPNQTAKQELQTLEDLIQAQRDIINA